MMNRARNIVSLLLGLGVILLVAACGSASGGQAAKDSASAAQGPAQEVKVNMGDFFYEPKEINVQPGRVRFVLVNVGQTAHRFALSGEGFKFEQSSKNVAAGREGILEVDLGPGTYKMGCTLGDHEQRGSVGKMVVQ
ncbi:MAG: cupredoxin domain-containing protein [Chloroflexi bacterium]|nr:cupredoxin domain-containing protein [Chloroflexota bacterium]